MTKKALLKKVEEEVKREKNLARINMELHVLGFDVDHIQDELKAKLQEGGASFQLSTTQKYGIQEVDYLLRFERYTNPMALYYPAGYLAEIKIKGDPDKRQTFNLHEVRVKSREAFNMLEGRAIHRQEQNFGDNTLLDHWYELSAKKDQNGNSTLITHTYPQGQFDLDRAIRNLPIKELSIPQWKNRILGALKEGDQVPVTLWKNNGYEQGMLTTNPKEKALSLFNRHGQKIKLADLKARPHRKGQRSKLQ